MFLLGEENERLSSVYFRTIAHQTAAHGSRWFSGLGSPAQFIEARRPNENAKRKSKLVSSLNGHRQTTVISPGMSSYANHASRQDSQTGRGSSNGCPKPQRGQEAFRKPTEMSSCRETDLRRLRNEKSSANEKAGRKECSVSARKTLHGVHVSGPRRLLVSHVGNISGLPSLPTTSVRENMSWTSSSQHLICLFGHSWRRA